MIGLAFGMAWIGYTFTLYGYCMVKGYNITLAQLLKPTWPPTTVDASQGGTQKHVVGNIPGR